MKNFTRWLENFFYRSAPSLSGPPIDWLKQKEKLVEDISERVRPLGLELQSSMDWTEREANALGLRKIFRVHDAGGLRPLTINWGYSLDFVPHISGDRVKWHRTFASAQRDFWFVPTSSMPHTDRALGVATFEGSAPHMISDGLERATGFWNARHDLGDVRSLLEKAYWQLHDIKKRGSDYLLLRSPLSLPFLLARIGDAGSASNLDETLDLLEASASVRRDAKQKLEALWNL